MQILPVEATPNQEFQVVLDGQNCTIALYQRNARMYIDIAVDEIFVCRGVVCLPTVGVPQNNTTFSGKIFVIDTRARPSQQGPPQWAELGTRWKFVFLNTEELAQLEAQSRI